MLTNRHYTSLKTNFTLVVQWITTLIFINESLGRLAFCQYVNLFIHICKSFLHYSQVPLTPTLLMVHSKRVPWPAIRLEQETSKTCWPFKITPDQNPGKSHIIISLQVILKNIVKNFMLIVS